METIVTIALTCSGIGLMLLLRSGLGAGLDSGIKAQVDLGSETTTRFDHSRLRVSEWR
jgi:hypothetical protein